MHWSSGPRSRIAPSFDCPLTDLGPLKRAQDLFGQACTRLHARRHGSPSPQDLQQRFCTVLLPLHASRSFPPLRRSIAAVPPITADRQRCNSHHRSCPTRNTARRSLPFAYPTHYDELAGVVATHAGQRKSLRIHRLFHASPVSGSRLACHALPCSANKLNVVPSFFAAPSTHHRYHVAATV